MGHEHESRTSLMSLIATISRQKHVSGRTMRKIILIFAIIFTAYQWFHSSVEMSGAKPIVPEDSKPPSHLLSSICEKSPIIRRLIHRSLGSWLSIEDDKERWWRIPELAEVWKPFFVRLDPDAMFSKDENKYFVRFLNPSDSCNLVTLGIGHHIEGEQGMLLKYPQCRYLAMDPEEEGNRQLVEEANGRYVQGAIGDRAGKYKGYFGIKGKYGIHDMMHISFVDFAKDYNENRLIDLLIVDVEGAEYGLLRALQEQADQLPAICQFNMELHASTQKYGNMSVVDFTTMFSKFLLDTPYALMKVDRYDPLKFHRLFFLNVRDSECIRKFIKCA